MGGGGGFHNNTSCIYFYTILKKASLSKLVSLHFIKSNNKLIQKALCPKVSYCKSFTLTLFREYHQTYSTPTQTHIGSDLDSIHFSSYFKKQFNTCIALDTTVKPCFKSDLLIWDIFPCQACTILNNQHVSMLEVRCYLHVQPRWSCIQRTQQ